MPYIHRHVGCVCVCVSEQKGKPSCSTGGGLGDRMAIQKQRHGVCVCVCLRAKGKTILFHRRGGWEIEWPYIHKDMVCVCVWQKGKPSCSTGGFSFLPAWPTRTVGKPQNRRGGGRACRRKAEHKTAAVGEGDAAEAEGYPVPQGVGGRGGENTL